MLHRSFKPAKCKTALKLAASRMKLLKNKREATVKQLKRELVQLLESGQDRTAMIRVEHVVREEKTLSAYELIEIYCELIVARLPIIESQKNCPIDLKEAIASVVFAAPRCADVPELADVRKHFTAKYGKEFTSAAVELRPDCGVGRMLIEKLSAKAPDGQAKIKILKSIAEEHNIKWDPAENEPKPPEDLLNGPSTFEKASQMHMDPPNVQVRPEFDGRGQSSFHVPSSHGEKSDTPANSYDHNRSSEQSTQSNAPTNMATNRATTSGTSRPEARHPGNGNEGVEVRQSYSGNGRNFSSGGQNWNMEFKNAAEAAQAAAESADRASMAARAAAELSGHVNVTRPSSSGSRGSYGLRGDLPVKRYSSSNSDNQHVGEDRAGSAFHGRVPSSNFEDQHVGKDKAANSFHGRVPSSDFEDQHVGKDQTANAFHGRAPSSNFEDQHVGKDQAANVFHGRVPSSNFEDQRAGKNQAANVFHERVPSSNFEDQRVGKDQAANDFHVRVPKVQSEQLNETEQDNTAGGVDERFYKHGDWRTNQSNQTSSLNSQASFSDDHHMVNSSQMTDTYSKNNTNRPGRSDITGQMSFDEPSSKADFESVSGEKNDVQSENIDYPEEEWDRKQPSRTSSRSHSRTFSDDHAVVSDPHNEAAENPFAINDEGNFRTDTEQSSSLDKAPLVFDESGSDDEDVFDAVSSKGHDESSLFFSSLGRKSPTHPSRNTNVWSPRQNIPHPVFSESSPVALSESSQVALQSDDLIPVTFDHSDGPSSDSEEEPENSKHVGIMEHTTSISEHESESHRKLLSQSYSNVTDSHEGRESSSKSLEKFGTNDFSSKQKKSQVDSDDNESHLSNDPVVELISPAQKLSSIHGEVNDDFHPPQIFDTIRDSEVVEESNSESGSEINLGKLTGGLRNKGYTRPPYVRNTSGGAFLSEQAVEDTSSSVSRVKTTVGSGASRRTSYNQNTRREVNEKPSPRASHPHLDDDDSDEEVPQPTLISTQEPHGNDTSIRVNQMSSSRSPPNFGSDDSDSEENLHKQTPTTKPRIGTGFSRRTKANPELSVRRSSQKGSDFDVERIETSTEPQLETKSSFHIGDLDWARRVTEPVSKPIPDSNRRSPAERTEPVSKPTPDSNRHSPVEITEPVSKSVPDSSRRYPMERNVAEPVSKPVPDSNRRYPTERKVAEPVSTPNQDFNRRSPVERTEPVSKPVPDFNRRSPVERKLAEPVSKPVPDSNRRYSAERRVAEPVSTPNHDSNRRSPVERTEPASRAIPDSIRRYPVEKEVAEPVSKPVQDFSRRYPEERKVPEAMSKDVPDSSRSSREGSLKSAATVRPSNSLPKVASGTAGSFKTSGSSVVKSPSMDKPSHVHPNLPDIDSLTAHLQSLRTNRG